MSECSEGDPAAIKQQYDKLSKEASSLANALARRRADIALRRAEAATVAVSLESAKDQLDTALRTENLIRSNAHQPTQAPLDPQHPHLLPDHGLIRALAGQLEVTRESVRNAEEKRASLRDEIDLLEHSSKDHKSPDHANAQLFAKLDLSADENMCFVNDGQLLPSEGNTGGVLSKPRRVAPARNSDEENALRALQESSESQSSFRFDHARVWRDVTMPNLTKVNKDSPKPTLSDTSLGVVTERIFEGVTCFTPTDASKGKDRASKELRIDNCGDLNRPSETVKDLVSQHYGSLVATTKENGTEVRLIAPKLALERVTDLVGDQDPDVAKRRRSVSTANDTHLLAANAPMEMKVNNKEEAKSKAPVIQYSTEWRNLRLQAERVSMRRSSRSEILADQQFAHIIAAGVPARFQESDLDLVYSTEVHGISLHTLYHRAAKSSPTLVVIRDTKNRVFGCYATQPWKSSATRYYGSGESFVFGAPNAHTIPMVYKWSRLNSFFQFTSGTFLAIGGGAGSHFALWIDEDLLMGTTSACSTFGSPPLIDTDEQSRAATREFKILSLEVWSFVAHRKH